MKTLALLFILSVFIFSCKSKPSRHELLTNYVAILIQISQANKKSNKLIVEINHVIDIASDPTKYFDSTVVDSLRKQYQKVQDNLNLRLKSITAFIEVDTELNLKEKSILYLEDSKRVFHEMFPPLFEVLPKRFIGMTSDQRSVMKNFDRLGKNFQNKSLAFSHELLAYNRKYKFTIEELQQYGL